MITYLSVRRFVNGALAVVAASAVSVLAVGVTRAGAVASQVADASSAPDPSTALQIASTYGHPVIDESTMSETEQTSALPDGSLQLTVSSDPVRVQQSTGAWVAEDTQLQSAGAVIVPAAAAVPVQFSSGGTGPLAQIQADAGQWLGESWPLGALPVPDVVGSSARYKDVFPGVDLVLTAKPSGMSQVLVVSNAQAAANPALQNVVIGLSTPQLTVTQQSGGTAAATDSSGATGLRAGAATWWDSSVPGSDVTGPGGVGDQRPVPSTVSDSAITIDVAATAGTASVTYPIYVDPAWTGGTISRTYTDAAYPTESYWNGAGASDSYQHVGYIDGPNSDDGRAHRTRAYWQIDTHAVIHDKINSAQFNTTNVYSSSCTPTPVELWTSGVATASTNWSNQPGLSSKLDTQTTAYNYSSACASPGGIGFDATAGVTRAAANGDAVINLALKATNESDWMSWKKFSSSAALVISYFPYPATPYSRSVKCTTPAEQAACSPSNSVIRDTNPTFRATSDDASSLNIDYEIEVWQGHSASPTSRPIDVTVHNVSAGQQMSWLSSVGLPDGDYEWRVQACLNVSTSVCSAWSTYLWFTIDKTAPTTPTLTAAPAGGGTGLGTASTAASGSVGQTAETITIAPGSATDGVYGYAYGTISGQGIATIQGTVLCGDDRDGIRVTCPGNNTTITVNIAAVDRISTFTAWSFDQAGNTSPAIPVNPDGTPQTLRGHGWLTFWANSDPGIGAGHQWLTDNGSSGASTVACTATGAPAADAHNPNSTTPVSPALPLTFNPGECWQNGASPNAQWAMKLDGSNYAHTELDQTGNNLPPTSSSFTIGAWIYPTSTGPTSVQTALSEDGASISGFFLQNSDGHWRFCAPRSQSTSSPIDCAIGPAVSVNTWVWVVGQWDSINQQLRLEVTGGTSGTPTVQTHTVSPDSTGRFIVGADMIGQTRRFFTGMVSNPVLVPGIADSGQIGFMSTGLIVS